jgi:peptidoglycan/LPS O-acetylase OafA/YrhL
MSERSPSWPSTPVTPASAAAPAASPRSSAAVAAPAASPSSPALARAPSSGSFATAAATAPEADTTATVHAPALGALRAALTLLVVLHHTLLAYHPFAPPVGPTLMAMPFWRAFPVVDAERWSGATWIVAWNDAFFMALMFLLSGLFVWPSLQRKGALAYARDRVLRLGLPFLVAMLVLSPLAYLPSYLQTGAAASWAGFWQQWLALDEWPTGPAWFLSLLLVFDAVALTLFSALRASGRAARRSDGVPRRPARLLATLTRSPILFSLALLTFAVAAYVPMAQHYGAMRWTSLGPLTFQTSRLFLYAAFFLAGLAVGASGLGHSILVSTSALARRWWGWTALAAFAFWVSMHYAIRAMETMGMSPGANRLAALGAAFACVAISLAMLALFLRFAFRGTSAITASLRRNAYGIYLFHYFLVSWLQYALLAPRWPGFAKAVVVFSGAVAAAWLLTSALRRLRPIARVL